MVKFISRIDILNVPYESVLMWRIHIGEKSGTRQ